MCLHLMGWLLLLLLRMMLRLYLLLVLLLLHRLLLLLRRLFLVLFEQSLEKKHNLPLKRFQQHYNIIPPSACRLLPACSPPGSICLVGPGMSPCWASPRPSQDGSSPEKEKKFNDVSMIGKNNLVELSQLTRRLHYGLKLRELLC